MTSIKLQKEIDRWENRTHVYVAFDNVNETIHLEGEFNDYELSEIASIQRKRLKELSPTLVKPEQKELFD